MSATTPATAEFILRNARAAVLSWMASPVFDHAEYMTGVDNILACKDLVRLARWARNVERVVEERTAEQDATMAALNAAHAKRQLMESAVTCEVCAGTGGTYQDCKGCGGVGSEPMDTALVEHFAAYEKQRQVLGYMATRPATAQA